MSRSYRESLHVLLFYQCLKMAGDLGGDGGRPQQDPGLNVPLLGRLCEVGGGQEDLLAIDHHYLGVQACSLRRPGFLQAPGVVVDLWEGLPWPVFLLELLTKLGQ